MVPHQWSAGIVVLYLRKQQVPYILVVHCITHRCNFIAKMLSLPLHQSSQLAVKAVNKIKYHQFSERLFRELCKYNDETFEQIFLHIAVR